jgi:hypothetical protein
MSKSGWSGLSASRFSLSGYIVRTTELQVWPDRESQTTRDEMSNTMQSGVIS